MNSRDYWKRRSLALEEVLHSRAEQTVKQITGLYDKAQENIIGQIEKTFSAYVKGGTLNEQKANQLLTVRETEEAREALREQYQTAAGQAKRDIWARLSAPAYGYRISRLQALRDQVYGEARALGALEVSAVEDRLTDTLEQSYYRTIFNEQQRAGVSFDFDPLSDNDIRVALATDWSGRSWSDRIWDNNQRFADAVEDTVTVGLLSGLRFDEMRDSLLAVIGLDDTAGARYNAARLIRTECNHIANQGFLMGYQAAGIDRYIYLATLDLRTSEVCRRLDGQRFPVSEAEVGVNLPPMHPNCRSVTMPDDDEGTLARLKRFARDPVTGKAIEVPGNMSYREWYEKYVSGNPQAEAKDGQRGRKNAAPGSDYQAISTGGTAPGTNHTEGGAATWDAEQLKVLEQDAARLGVQANYTGFNPELASAVNQSIADVQDFFGNLENLKAVSEYTGEREIYAGYQPSTGTIFLKNVGDRGIMEQMAEDAKKQHTFGGWSTDAPTHAIVHEISHAFEKQYLTEEKRAALEELRRAEVLRVTGSADTDILGAINRKNDLVPVWGLEAQADLSLYGISSVSELIAESVAQNILSKPGNLAQQVIFILTMG